MSRRQLLAGGGAVLASLALSAESAAGSLTEALAGLEGEALWSEVKRRFLIEEGLAYFNTGTYGPSPRAVFDSERRAREAMNLNFNQYFVDHHVGEPFLRLVQRVADYVGADRHEITFTAGATEAISTVANGLDLGPGDEVLTTTHEHQGGIYPWLLGAKRRGYRVRQLPVPPSAETSEAWLELFAGSIKPETRVLSFCHIQYTDGACLPVEAICRLARERGVLTLVDGAQAVGQLDFRVRDLGCDFYATSLHKWLNGPYGTGLLVIREELLDRVWPTVVHGHDGWDSVDRYGVESSESVVDFATDWPRALLKFGANLHYFGPLIWALLPAIALQEAVGRRKIENRVRELASALRAGLEGVAGLEVVSPRGAELSAGLVSFRIPGADTRALAYGLRREEGIVIRNVTHAPIAFDVNRACTHIFNSEEEITRLLRALERKATEALKA